MEETEPFQVRDNAQVVESGTRANSNNHADESRSNGPLNFDVSSFDGSLPSFILNPYSWTKVANIIFIDSPVGTGFSYANTSQGYDTSDTKSTKDKYTFLRKWLLSHPTFIKNRLYVAGDSYGGKIVPMVALEIAEGNEAGIEPRISLQGYFIGNSMAGEGGFGGAAFDAHLFNCYLKFNKDGYFTSVISQHDNNANVSVTLSRFQKHISETFKIS